MRHLRARDGSIAQKRKCILRTKDRMHFDLVAVPLGVCLRNAIPSPVPGTGQSWVLTPSKINYLLIGLQDLGRRDTTTDPEAIPLLPPCLQPFNLTPI